LSVDLDSEPPSLSDVDPYLWTLAKGESEVFKIEAWAEKCYCEWVAEFHLVIDGKPMVVRADDGGRPLRTTGDRAAVPAKWEDGRWKRCPLDKYGYPTGCSSAVRAEPGVFLPAVPKSSARVSLG
jgi:hypothetical protein